MNVLHFTVQFDPILLKSIDYQFRGQKMKISPFLTIPLHTQQLISKKWKQFFSKCPPKEGFFYFSPCGRGRDQRERVRGVLQFWRDEYLFGSA